MSPDLEQIRKRTTDATPGPWSVGQHWEDEDRALTNWLPINSPGRDPDNPHQPERVALIRYFPGMFQFPHHEARNDAEFIAHAREDVPALLAEIERLRAQALRDRPVLEAAEALREAMSASPYLGAPPEIVDLIAAVDARVADTPRETAEAPKIKLPVCAECGHRHRWGGEHADHNWRDSCPYEAGAGCGNGRGDV